MLAQHSRVDAISLDDGSLIWSSPVVEGVCSGTPALSSVGDMSFSLTTIWGKTLVILLFFSLLMEESLTTSPTISHSVLLLLNTTL